MTTTAIARKDNAVTLEPRRADVDDVVDFPSLVAMGDQLVKTGFLPDHIRTGTQFAAIVMTGKELGMTTMRATRSLFLVKGKVIEDAASQLARFKAAGGHADFKTLDETKAVLWLQHPNGDEHTETWTVDDSKRAGLSGGNHEKFRKAMLRSRVITSGLKSIGWDGAVGAYDAAEFADEAPPSTPSPAKTIAASVVDADVVVDADEVRRIKEARAGIAAQAKRLGWMKDGKVDGDTVTAQVRLVSGGTTPADSIGWEDALAVIKEMEPAPTPALVDADSAEAFAARDDKATTTAAAAT